MNKKHIYISVVAFMFMILSGCNNTSINNQRLPLVTKNIDKVIHNAVSVGFKLNSLVAHSSMKAVDKKENFTLRCSAQILAKRPDKLHIIATKGLGTEIMNLSMVGESLDIWLPRKSTLYRGSISDLNEADMNFHPQDIVEQILFPSKTFLNNKWTKLFEDENNILIEAKQPELGRHLLTISKKTSLLTRRQLFNKTDDCVIDVSFSSYKMIEELDNKFYPHKFHLRFPNEDKDLFIVLRNITFNDKLKSSDFYLVVPKEDNVKVKPLKSEKNKNNNRKDMLHELESSQE